MAREMSPRGLFGGRSAPSAGGQIITPFGDPQPPAWPRLTGLKGMFNFRAPKAGRLASANLKFETHIHIAHSLSLTHAVPPRTPPLNAERPKTRPLPKDSSCPITYPPRNRRLSLAKRLRETKSRHLISVSEYPTHTLLVANDGSSNRGRGPGSWLSERWWCASAFPYV
jgi:hypothetical protein